MSMRQASWAIVLAAGDGSRLSALTTDERGATVPKQFCSLNGGFTLLQEALLRARRIVPSERVCAIVARRHEHHWRRLLSSLRAENVIVQPRNCGTANGVLLGLLHILDRDPLARITFLPADHYVRDEATFAASVRSAATRSAAGPDGITLVGIEPDDVDPDLGYIVPGAMLDDGTRRVEQFVEKPAPAVALDLVARGAVWNSFIFWAHAATLLALIRRRLPEMVDDMAHALARDWRRAGRPSALAQLYDRLPVVDFSRSVVQGAESELRLSTGPACGWTDLGTPGRVGKTVQRLSADSAVRLRESAGPALASVDLATKLARFSAVVGRPSDDAQLVSQ
jgi:mannose-1-phosphate guanylyltransferase